MGDKEFKLPNIKYRKYARMTDILYSTLLQIVATYNIQIAYQNKIDQINSKELYEAKKTMYIDELRSFMDNAIDAKEISHSTRSVKAYVTEMDELQETSINFGGEYQNYDLNADDRRLNLDINVRSFVLWTSVKQVPIPVEFYEYNQIDIPTFMRRNTIDMTDDKVLMNKKVLVDLSEVLVRFAKDIAERDNPTNEQFEQIFKEHLALVTHYNAIKESEKKIFGIVREGLGNWITQGRTKTSARDKMVKAAIYLAHKNISALSDDHHNLKNTKLIKELGSSGLRLVKSDSETVVNLFLEYLGGEK